MNLETLKQRNARATPIEWNGETIYLRKISARDGAMLLSEITAKAKAVGDGQADDHAETIAYHAKVVSKAMCDASGTLTLDTDEGREALQSLAFEELVSLGELVLANNGFAEPAKKN
jgi:hypothetical protein